VRVVFAGTPAFAAAALRRLIQARFEIPLVLTQPDRPAGRGLRLQLSPVKQLALQHGLGLEQPRSLRLDGKWPEDAVAARAALEAAAPDVMVVAAYGLILPPWLLELPRHGCLNIHASLLPRWRGAAPIQRALIAGDAETGVSIMAMEAGLDTGPVLVAEAVPIGPRDTGGTLHDRLAALGARLVVAALERLDDLVPAPQPEAGVTYAAKIDKAEARVDWSRPAVEVDRLIRGLAPFPGAWSELGGERVKLLMSEVAAGAGPPGTVLDGRLTVACGEGAVRLLRLQRAGKAALAAEAFLRGQPVGAGVRLS
jgi:methionyl-tRNA formyltransferase